MRSTIWLYDLSISLKTTCKDVCYFCFKICSSDQDLREHILQDHGKAYGGEKSQICTLCEKSFTWKNSLHMHIMKAHKARYSNLQKKKHIFLSMFIMSFCKRIMQVRISFRFLLNIPDPFHSV